MRACPSNACLVSAVPCTCRPACACLRIALQDALALMHTVWHLPSIRLALVLEGATTPDESWLCKTQGASPNLDPALDSYCFCPSPFCVDLRLAWEYHSLCPVTLSSHFMRGAQHWQPSCVALHKFQWKGSCFYSQPSARACRHLFNSLRAVRGRHTASTQTHSAWESSRACTRFSHTPA